MDSLRTTARGSAALCGKERSRSRTFDRLAPPPGPRGTMGTNMRHALLRARRLLDDLGEVVVRAFLRTRRAA